MTRAVLDANVFVSAVLSPRGIPAKVLAAWHGQQFALVISEAILAEIARVLRYPKIASRHQWSEEKIGTLLEDLAHLGILTPGETRLRVIREDPSDNRYLECAVEGEAEFIVSGDRDLLSLGSYRGIAILTPGAFWEVLKSRQEA